MKRRLSVGRFRKVKESEREKRNEREGERKKEREREWEIFLESGCNRSIGVHVVFPSREPLMFQRPDINSFSLSLFTLFSSVRSHSFLFSLCFYFSLFSLPFPSAFSPLCACLYITIHRLSLFLHCLIHLLFPSPMLTSPIVPFLLFAPLFQLQNVSPL